MAEDVLKDGDKVVRRAELGTVIANFPVGEKPADFEGDWPESPESPRGLVVVQWPGRKKLTVEPRDRVIKVDRGQAQ